MLQGNSTGSNRRSVLLATADLDHRRPLAGKPDLQTQIMGGPAE